MEKGELSKIRSKPGESNAHAYKTKGPYAGPDQTYPINTLPRARNALARAHFAKSPEQVKSKVYKEYPQLKERHQERQKNDKRYQAYKSK